MGEQITQLSKDERQELDRKASQRRIAEEKARKELEAARKAEQKARERESKINKGSGKVEGGYMKINGSSLERHLESVRQKEGEEYVGRDPASVVEEEGRTFGEYRKK